METKKINQTPEFKKLSDTISKKADLKEIMNDAFESLKKDEAVKKEIKKLGLTNKEVKDNLGIILDLQDDLSACAHCPGLEHCQKDNIHHKLEIINDNGFLTRRFSLCEKAHQRKIQENRYFRRDFPKEWLEAALEKADTTKDRNPLLMKMVSILNKKTSEWLYLTGELGSGRSYLLTSFANDFASRVDMKIAYVDAASIIDDLRSKAIHDKIGFEKEMASLVDTPLLVFDGFGDEYKSEFALSTVLFPILRERAKKNLMTAFASDFSLSEIEEMYTEKSGAARARQLTTLIKKKAGKEIKLKGLAIY